MGLMRLARSRVVNPLAASFDENPLAASFDEIDVLILAQIDACQIAARSVGIGAMQGEQAGLVGRDRHRKFFAGGEIGDNSLW
jgi:hypothetical protein